MMAWFCWTRAEHLSTLEAMVAEEAEVQEAVKTMTMMTVMTGMLEPDGRDPITDGVVVGTTGARTQEEHQALRSMPLSGIGAVFSR